MSEKQKDLNESLVEIGISEDLIEKIKNDLGAEQIEDIPMLAETDLTNLGMKVIQARKLLSSFKNTESVNTAALNQASFAVYDGLLPSVPDDESWVKSLKASGVLKVDQSSIISAIRAALAYKSKLFEIPGIIVNLMEQFAEANEEPIDEKFFVIRGQIIRKSYAEIFSAIEGLNGDFVTEKRKKMLFEKIDKFLFPAIWNFNEALKSWQDAWMQGATNPSMVMMLMATQGMAAPPPNMLQAPDTGMVRDSADAVNDAINKTFAGMGVTISAALAYDATQIRDILQDPKLPALVGAGNRDQMLRMTGAAVNATYPRLEQNLIRFALGILQINDQPDGNEGLMYYSALASLGSQIQFEQLGIDNGRVTSIDGKIII